MQALPLTRLNCVLETADALAGRGIPFEALRWRRGFRNWLAGDPDGLIPVDEHLCILEAAAAAAGSASFGLEVGRRSRLDSQGAFGRRILQAPTLSAALASFCRFMPWQASSAHFWLVECCDRIWFCRSQQKGTERQLRLQEQRIVMRMINLVRLSAGPRWAPETIQLCAGPEPRLEETAFLSGVAVRYRQPYTAVAVPRCLLGFPFARPAAASEGIDRELRASAPARDFAGSVEQVIQSLLLVNGTKIEAVAEIAGCSVRSLQRRLARQGFHYSDLVDRARFGLAARRLAANDGTMIDIALGLGYADHSHFSRAFRRWAGISPREYRRSHALLSQGSAGRAPAMTAMPVPYEVSRHQPDLAPRR